MLQENILKEALRLNRRLPDLCWRIMCTIVNGEFSDLRCLMKTLNSNNNHNNNNNNNNSNNNNNNNNNKLSLIFWKKENSDTRKLRKDSELQGRIIIELTTL